MAPGGGAQREEGRRGRPPPTANVRPPTRLTFPPEGHECVCSRRGGVGSNAEVAAEPAQCFTRGDERGEAVSAGGEKSGIGGGRGRRRVNKRKIKNRMGSQKMESVK